MVPALHGEVDHTQHNADTADGRTERGEFLKRHASPPSIVRAEIDQLVSRRAMAGLAHDKRAGSRYRIDGDMPNPPCRRASSRWRAKYAPSA